MDDMSGRTLHVAARAGRVSTWGLVETKFHSLVSLNERLLAQQRELVSQMDALGIDTSRVKTRLGEFEKKHRQYIDYMHGMLSRSKGGGLPQRVVSLEHHQTTLNYSEERLGQAGFAERRNREIASAANGPQEPLTRCSSEYALAPILDQPNGAPLLQGEAATHRRPLSKSDAEADEARARLKALRSSQDKEGGRVPLVTEQGIRLNAAFLKIGSVLLREAVTSLAEELATKKSARKLATRKTVESDPAEGLRLIGSFARIDDANLRRALIELTEAIVEGRLSAPARREARLILNSPVRCRRRGAH
jgi:hypothetical protein